MFDSCKACGHKLWAETHQVGSFSFVVHFDDDEGSGSYAEHVSVCPGCRAGLHAAAADPGAVSLDA